MGPCTTVGTEQRSTHPQSGWVLVLHTLVHTLQFTL